MLTKSVTMIRSHGSAHFSHELIGRRTGMREFCKVYPQIWIGNTGRKIKQHGIETQLLTQYLISSPHANMTGIYYLPISFIAHETGLSLQAISKGMRVLNELDFCSYDENKEYVWIHNMAFYQIGSQLKPSDNRVKYVNNYYKSLPQLIFLDAFYERYLSAYYLEHRDDVKRMSEVPSKPLLSQEKEIEKENEKEKKEEQKNQIDDLSSADINIPLVDGTQFTVAPMLIEKWQEIFPSVNVFQVLTVIKEWNISNPAKRKTESNILKHINLWLEREQDKSNYKKINVKATKDNTLFSLNQSIADEWLERDAVMNHGELH